MALNLNKINIDKKRNFEEEQGYEQLYLMNRIIGIYLSFEPTIEWLKAIKREYYPVFYSDWNLLIEAYSRFEEKHPSIKIPVIDANFDSIFNCYMTLSMQVVKNIKIQSEKPDLKTLSQKKCEELLEKLKLLNSKFNG